MIFTLASNESGRVYNGVTVLVVDDDTEIRQILRVILEEEGYSVLEAEDGAAALDILRASPEPLVIITNHRMPHLDGPGLIDAMYRDSGLSARHVLIYMTANTELISPDLRSELKAMQSPILAKPFKIDVVLDLVAAASERLPDAPGHDGRSHPGSSSALV